MNLPLPAQSFWGVSVVEGRFQNNRNSYAANHAIQCLAIHKQADGTFVLRALFEMNCKQWTQLLIGPELTFFESKQKKSLKALRRTLKRKFKWAIQGFACHSDTTMSIDRLVEVHCRVLSNLSFSS